MAQQDQLADRDPSSNFDKGVEGWRSWQRGGALPVHEQQDRCDEGIPVDDAPGRGCLRLDDGLGSYYYFRAPRWWTGNEDWTRFYGGQLRYWLKVSKKPNRYGPSEKQPAVVIKGENGTLELVLPWGSWPSEAWRKYDFPLREGIVIGNAKWTRDTKPATEEDFVEVLEAVSDLIIRGEYYTGYGSDSAWLDDVELLEAEEDGTARCP